jgi:hypothetical protein
VIAYEPPLLGRFVPAPEYVIMSCITYAFGLNAIASGAAMNNDHERLVTALEPTLANWNEWKRSRTLASGSQWPPDDGVVAPLVAAIQECEVFKSVQGRSLFSGNSGVILHARALAPEMLYRAERADKSAAADWLIRVLATRYANGFFIAAIWGLSVDREVEIAEGMTLVPFGRLAESTMKRRITNQAKTWHTAVWISQRYFDVPGAAIVKKVPDFPYVGAPDKSVQRLEELEDEAKAPLTFLQASAAGQPLAVASWFEYEDTDLDFNDHENHLSWFLPEVVPHIRSHVAIDATTLAQSVTIENNPSRTGVVRRIALSDHWRWVSTPR